MDVVPEAELFWELVANQSQKPFGADHLASFYGLQACSLCPHLKPQEMEAPTNSELSGTRPKSTQPPEACAKLREPPFGAQIEGQADLNPLLYGHSHMLR